MKESEALEIVGNLIGKFKLPWPITKYDVFSDDDHEVFIFSDKDIYEMEQIEDTIELYRGVISQNNIMYYYVLDRRK
jgi:hypothetical protein